MYILEVYYKRNYIYLMLFFGSDRSKLKESNSN